MSSYCLKCTKNTKNKNLRIVKIKNKNIMLLSNCAVSGHKNSRLIEDEKASRIKVSLVKTLSKTPLVGPVLFKEY